MHANMRNNNKFIFKNNHFNGTTAGVDELNKFIINYNHFNRKIAGGRQINYR